MVAVQSRFSRTDATDSDHERSRSNANQIENPTELKESRIILMFADLSKIIDNQRDSTSDQQGDLDPDKLRSGMFHTMVEVPITALNYGLIVL